MFVWCWQCPPLSNITILHRASQQSMKFCINNYLFFTTHLEVMLLILLKLLRRFLPYSRSFYWNVKSLFVNQDPIIHDLLNVASWTWRMLLISKSIHDKFIHLVRAHHRVKWYHLNQRHTNSVSKMKENLDKILGYMLKRDCNLQRIHKNCCSATQHFTLVYSSDNTQCCCLPSWVTKSLPWWEAAALSMMHHCLMKQQSLCL